MNAERRLALSDCFGWLNSDRSFVVEGDVGISKKT